MSTDRKQQVVDLLKALETRNPEPFSYINPHKYIQHNLGVADGPAGVAALAASLPPETKVNTVRVFQDGDFVFAQTDYDFFGSKIGFDIFRFEDGRIVEHWDNLQVTAAPPSPSGNGVIEAPATATDLDKTDANKAFIKRYTDDSFAGRRVHMILGEGNFVLVVSEAAVNGTPTAIYDLYRVEDSTIAEHWDIAEIIPPRSEWKNDNGKF